jgi:hypothetical protein
MISRQMFVLPINHLFILFSLLQFFCISVSGEDCNRIRITTQSGKIGYLNKQGALVIDTSYFFVDTALANTQFINRKVKTHSDFSRCGIAKVHDDSGIVMIDTNGHKLYRPFIFDNAMDEYSQGIARFKLNDKFGFFDSCGRITIPAQYQFVERFNQNRAVFSNDCLLKKNGEHTEIVGGKWGFIDKTGTIVISPIFDGAGNFENGCSNVVKGDETFFIDTNGIRQTGVLKRDIFDIIDSDNTELLNNYIAMFGYPADMRAASTDDIFSLCDPPLFYAVIRDKKLQIIEMLLHAGATPYETNCQKISVLKAAQKSVNRQIIALLRKNMSEKHEHPKSIKQYK